MSEENREFKLLPCPFCGPKPGYEPYVSGNDIDGYAVRCGWCEVRGEREYRDRAREHAIESWSTRAYPAVDIDLVEKLIDALDEEFWPFISEPETKLIDDTRVHYAELPVISIEIIESLHKELKEALSASTGDKSK
jgi:hypothetical protein